MTTIWKFPFTINDTVELDVPAGALLRSVQVQDDVATMWFQVMPKEKKLRRRYRIFGTGHEIPSRPQLEYVATIQQPPFVWHIFEDVAAVFESH